MAPGSEVNLRSFFKLANPRMLETKFGKTSINDHKTYDPSDSAIQRSGLTTKDMFSGEWNDEKTAELLKNSPVMKAYTKGPTTIGELESMGRLIRL